MKECPREYDCDNCIFKNTLECPFEPQIEYKPDIDDYDLGKTFLLD